jgi:lipopolysaccharide export system protein LptA
VIAGAAILLVLAAPSLTKLPASSGGPVTISAERVRYSLTKRRIDYEGKPVRLTRGDATLTCQHLAARMNEADQVVDATCEGDVRLVRADKIVTCQKATYDATASRLTCEGKSELRNGAVTVTGSRLVYDLERDEVAMEDVQGNVPSDEADARLKELQSRRKAKPGEGHR